MQSQIRSFIWFLKETSQAVQSDEKLHSLVICMIIYDLGGKFLVVLVSLAALGNTALGKSLPWSSVL